MNTNVETKVWEFIGNQIKSDIKNMMDGKSISLCSKWLASENTSSKQTKELGRKTREFLGLSPKKYRKILSALRKHIDVIERKMCSNEWSSIDFEKVPSKASLNYRKAFGKHDQNRYAAYLKSVEKGEKKINAGALYPYEIFEKLDSAYIEQDIKSLDLLWKNMPNWLEGNEGNFLTISDTSGSMSGRPMMVSVSLAVYFAQRNTGPFHNVWINFSDNPTFQIIKGNNIKEIWNNIDFSNWNQSTNVQAAFDLILSTATKYKVKQKDIPKAIFVISDMEFNVGCRNNNKTNFDLIKQKFAKHGYEMPKIVWWNVNARNDNFPIREDDNGTCLVSGCSPSIFKSVMKSKSVDPMSAVYETVNVERYNRVVI